MSLSTSRYSNRAIWVHWISAILIFGLIFTGIQMEHLPMGDHKFLLYRIHFTLGIVVFILTLFRLMILIQDPKPKSLYPAKTFKNRLKNVVYCGFYGVLIWMCVSGLVSLSLECILPALRSGNLVDLPDISADGFHPIMLSHHIVAKIVFLLLIFHIAGFALYWIQHKENALKRIWLSK